jgi:hypothetical protein
MDSYSTTEIEDNFPHPDQFREKLQTLKTEHRYRTFANLERLVGEAPYALWHKGPDEIKKVIVNEKSETKVGKILKFYKKNLMNFLLPMRTVNQ